MRKESDVVFLELGSLPFCAGRLEILEDINQNLWTHSMVHGPDWVGGTATRTRAAYQKLHLVQGESTGSDLLVLPME